MRSTFSLTTANRLFFLLLILLTTGFIGAIYLKNKKYIAFLFTVAKVDLETNEVAGQSKPESERYWAAYT